MLLEILEALDPVPKLCRILVVEAGHGALHAALECGEWCASATIQKPPRYRHFSLVSFPAHSPGAWCQAGAQLGSHAEGRPSLTEDFQLIVEKHGRGPRAIPEAYDVSQFPDRATHRTHRRKGSEIERAIRNGARDGHDPGCDFPREFHEGIDPLSLVLHVEPGLPTLNEFHLTDQSRKLVRDVFPLDSVGFPDQLGCLLPWRSPEVRQEPCTHPDRLTHIQRVSVGAQHLIDARTVFGMSPYVFAEGRRGHGRLKSLRGGGLKSSILDFRFSFGKYRACRRKEPLPRPGGFR